MNTPAPGDEDLELWHARRTPAARRVPPMDPDFPVRLVPEPAARDRLHRYGITSTLRQDEVMARAREHGRTEEGDVVVTFKAYVSVPGGAYTVTPKASLAAQDQDVGTLVDTLADDPGAGLWQQETLWPAA